MKISINIDPDLTNTEIVINCSGFTAEAEKNIAALRMADNQLTATKDGGTHIHDVSKIAYIETVFFKIISYSLVIRRFQARLELPDHKFRL